MTDHADTDATEDLPGEIAVVLARAETWAELPPSLEDAVVAAIAAEASSDSRPPAPAVDLEAARARRTAEPPASQRRSSMPWWLAAAAAVALIITGVVLVTRAGDETVESVEFAMVGTELAPGATATVVFDNTPAGLKITLDASGLPGASEGEMYEAWVGNGDIRVSADSFHLRGGDAPIDLWAGVDDPSFGMITVTIEPIDGEPSSSGNVVLRGEFDMPD